MAPTRSLLRLDDALDLFRYAPSPRHAGIYLDVLMQYEADGMIGDDTFRDGLWTIAEYLKQWR